MESFRKIHLLLFLLQFGKCPLRGTASPIAEPEEGDDFQLKHLCNSIENDTDKKEKCIQCFITIADAESVMEVAKCVHNLPQKVAECVKKMANPTGEKKFENCRLPQVENLEKEEIHIHNDTLVDATDHLKTLFKLWKEYNNTLALRSLLEFIEENHKDDFQKFATIIETCEKEFEKPEAMEDNDESTETEAPSEDTEENSNDTQSGESKGDDEEDSKSKRDTEDVVDSEREIRFCDKDAAQVWKITECIQQSMIANPEILQELKTRILEAQSPIPYQIVRALLKERDE